MDLNSRLRQRHPSRADIRTYLGKDATPIRVDVIFRDLHEMADPYVEEMFHKLQQAKATGDADRERQAWGELIRYLGALSALED
jgi:hypothetical protein